jgi:hypothetical protein
MASEALYNRGIHLAQGNAAQPQPMEEVSRGAGAARKSRRTALGVEILGEKRIGLDRLAVLRRHIQ